jgi:hypothetical protein
VSTVVPSAETCPLEEKVGIEMSEAVKMDDKTFFILSNKIPPYFINVSFLL